MQTVRGNFEDTIKMQVPLCATRIVLFLCTTEANRYVIRFKASLVCCIWSSERTSFPGGPPWSRAGTDARARKSAMLCSYFLQMSPDLILRAIRWNLNNISKNGKVAALIKATISGNLATLSHTRTKQTHTPILNRAKININLLDLKLQTRHKTQTYCNYLHMPLDTQTQAHPHILLLPHKHTHPCVYFQSMYRCTWVSGGQS